MHYTYSIFYEERYLQISVNDSHVMEIFNSIQDLMDELAGIPLRVEPFLHNSVKKFSTRNSGEQKNMSKKLKTSQKLQKQVCCDYVETDDKLQLQNKNTFFY